MVGLDVSFDPPHHLSPLNQILIQSPSPRTRSAIPGVSASQITKSCKCLLASTGNTASTAVKATSTKTTSTAKATSTAAACKKRRKVRRTVTVEVPAEATPSV